MAKGTKEEILEKLRKLQRLAENAGTEGEAQAALLAFQKLMAKHDINSEEVREEDEVVVEEVTIKVTRGKLETKANSWIIDLQAVIGSNFRCDVIYGYNAVSFIGLRRDVPLASTAMKAAMVAVKNLSRARLKIYREDIRIEEHIRRERAHDTRPFDDVYIEACCNEARLEYRKGFVVGLNLAYEQQVADSAKTGEIILISRHPAVKAYTDALTLGKGKSWVANGLHDLYGVGRQDGESFGAGNRIREDKCHERASLSC